jgi:Raf kinase inhibitor-like YbhB/YbcL family protein
MSFGAAEGLIQVNRSPRRSGSIVPVHRNKRAMQLRSSAFESGKPIPRRFTCDGEDFSPPLEWSGAPAGVRSFALLCDDPDAPSGTWHHWALYDIPSDRTSLVEGASAANGLMQAVNDFHRPGYGGPCPPRGHGPHRYFFRLLALSVDRLTLHKGASCADAEREARKHLLAEATLMGIYER